MAVNDTLLTLTCIVVLIGGLLWIYTFFEFYQKKKEMERLFEEISKFFSSGSFGSTLENIKEKAEDVYDDVRQDIKQDVHDVASHMRQY